MKDNYKLVIPVYRYSGDSANFGLGNKIILYYDDLEKARKLQRRCNKIFQLKTIHYNMDTGKSRFIEAIEREIEIEGFGFINGESKLFKVTEELI